MTDSEQVPWGKGEKQPGKGDEIVPETVYLQGAEHRKVDRVPIEEWPDELTYTACLSLFWDEDVVKARVNSPY